MSDPKRSAPTEWPTLLLLAGCYAAWALATTWLAALWLPAGIALTTLAIALHSSLSHEMIHGHPFPDRRVNEALVFPALTLVVPYRRFRDTHLEHHRDSLLTDPYDDPESNYWDPAVWQRLKPWQQAILRVNNTLAGRLLIGPAVGTWAFTLSDLRAIRAGRAGVLSGWLWHLPALVPVALWLGHVAQMPVWAYLLSAYMGLSILKIRTFLEHQAHERARGRTVIIEDRGILAFLFLNNNLHVVHHMHPRMPWYRLPGLYQENRARYLGRNGGYRYGSYGEIFRRYFLKAKDPVPHPLWHSPE
ncbi:fatty acid desaturase [Pseudooceanicola nanhaiensis]|jgi:fatty acid desaturase|uniref:Fatty acid desaturase n=1 Tax=Pseudooceanicola nanhaiensis TaxID=375761 RepID=A0A917SJ45_9RHOB|nr:fatty acid desaturase [Pseudooceanicola nanhaiensis]GGL84999.1 fatty acid desaturase [Pseudooceanicola nanhaiensis]